jgi:hypothetical protein
LTANCLLVDPVAIVTTISSIISEIHPVSLGSPLNDLAIHHRHLDAASSREPEMVDGRLTLIATKRLEAYEVVNGPKAAYAIFSRYFLTNTPEKPTRGNNRDFVVMLVAKVT